MAVARPLKNTDWVATLRRVMDSAWWGRPIDGVAKPPDLISQENLESTNAAGTGLVNLIQSNGSDITEFPNANGNLFDGAVTVTGATTPTGGIAAVAGTGASAGRWVMAYTPVASTTGNNTTGVQNQQFIGPVFVPVNATLTGVAFLIGTTGGTDKAIVALYDNTGALLANSVTTGGGTTVGTGSTIQSLAFTATKAVKGPATYWVSVQYTGNTAKIQTIPIGVHACGINTASGSAPDPTLTLPTSFTANAAPVACVY